MANLVHFPFDAPGAPSQRLRFGSRQVGSGLTNSLCFLTFLNEGGGVKIENLLDGKSGLLSGTTLPSWTNGYLRTGAAAGASAGIDFGVTPQTADLGLGAFTFVARVRADGAFASSGGLARRNDGNSVNAGWEINIATGGTILAIERATTNLSAKTTVALATGKFVTVAFVYLGDLTAANVEIYYDGIPQAHTGDTNGSGIQGSDASQNMFLGQSNFSNNGIGGGVFGGSIDWAGIWRRRLRREEILLLSADPYALVRPARFTTWLYFNKVEGAATADGDATASATPKVTFSAVAEAEAVAISQSLPVTTTGAADGDSTAAAVGRARVSAAGSAAGDAADVGVGVEKHSSVGSAAGDSTALAVGLGITFDYDTIDWSDCAVKINGVDYEVQAETLSWEENYSSTPQTARFRLIDVDPPLGAEVQIVFGGVLKVFGGYITTVNVVQEEDAPLSRGTRYDVSAIGYAWLYSLPTVNRQFKATSPSDVIQVLKAYVPGISLGTLDLDGVTDDVTFTNSPVSNALTQMAQAGGGMWRVEPNKTFEAFQTDPINPPDDATPDHATIMRFRAQRDLTQYVNKVRVEGGGTNALADAKDNLDDTKEVPIDDGAAIVDATRIKVNGRLYQGVSTYRHGIFGGPDITIAVGDDDTGPFNTGDTAFIMLSFTSQFGETTASHGGQGGGVGMGTNFSLHYTADPILFGPGSDEDPTNSGAGPIQRVNVYRSKTYPESVDSNMYLVTSYDPRVGLDFLDTMGNEQLGQQPLAPVADTTEVDILNYTGSESASDSFTAEDDLIRSGDAINVFMEASEASDLDSIIGVSLDAQLDLQDGRLSAAGAQARADAELAARHHSTQVSVEYECYDMKNRPGKVIHVDMPAPTNITGDLVIRRVSYSWIKTSPQLPPKVRVSEATPYGAVPNYTIERVLASLMQPPIIGRENATVKMPAIKELKPPGSPFVPRLGTGTFVLRGDFINTGSGSQNASFPSAGRITCGATAGTYDVQTDTPTLEVLLTGDAAGTYDFGSLPSGWKPLSAQLDYSDASSNFYGGDDTFVNAHASAAVRIEAGNEVVLARLASALDPPSPFIDVRFPDTATNLFTRGFGARFTTDGAGVAFELHAFVITGTYQVLI